MFLFKHKTKAGEVGTLPKDTVNSNDLCPLLDIEDWPFKPFQAWVKVVNPAVILVEEPDTIHVVRATIVAGLNAPNTLSRWEKYRFLVSVLDTFLFEDGRLDAIAQSYLH